MLVNTLLQCLFILQILTAYENKIECSEICYILKALYQAVVPSSVELENESAKTIITDMIPCFQMCIKYAEENYSCSDLVNNEFFPILYHIIRTFIKAVSIVGGISFYLSLFLLIFYVSEYK